MCATWEVAASAVKDTETALWGLTGTPCLDDFTSVAKLVRACSDVDLLVFRRQLDAKDLVLWWCKKDGKRTAWHGIDMGLTWDEYGMNMGWMGWSLDLEYLDLRRCSNTFSDQYFLNAFCIFLYHSVGRQSDKIMAWIQAQRALDYLARANGDLKGLEAPRVSQSLRRCTLCTLTLRSTWNQESVDLWIDSDHGMNWPLDFFLIFGSDSMIRVTYSYYLYSYYI